MKRCLLPCLLTSILFLSTPAAAQEQKVVDEIVALVDDDILLRSDVNGLIFNLLQQQSLEYQEGMFEEALQNLIGQKVLATHARRDTNFTIEAQEVEALLQQRVDQMAAQLGGQAQLEAAYGKSLLELKRDLKDDFEDQLYAERFQQAKLAKIRVTPSEVENWFSQIPADSLPEVPESVRMSHIVKFAEPTEAAREDANFILTTIRDSIVTGGGSMEDLARAFSNDPGSAENGGRYAGVRISVFVPEFAAVASRIPMNEVSEIFETEFGLHILKVTDRRGDVVDLNQILVAFDIDKFDATEAIEELGQLRDSVLAGGSFPLLAREHSAEAISSADGGRVSDPRSGERNLMLDGLGPQWRSTLLTLEPGEISQPTEVKLLDGRSAYHILLLHDRVPAHTVSLQTDYELVANFALREKQARVIDSWLKELQKDVFIEIRS